MLASTSFLARLAVVAPLLASTLAAPSSILARRQDQSSAAQLILSDPSPSYISNDAADELASTPARQHDFVEAMLIEAQRKGLDVSQWGVNQAQMEEVMRGSRVQHVDLNDAAQRGALMAEAAAEEGLAWIQPIVEEFADEHRIKVHMAVKQAKNQAVEAATQPGSGWIWNVCGSHQEAVVLDDINVKPDPPVAGRNLTVYARGTVNADIDDGAYADVVVKLGFIRLISRRFDICELARENDAELQCPLKPGQYEITHTVELPREIPPARFNVHVSGKTQADVDLMCMDLSIDFSHH